MSEDGRDKSGFAGVGDERSAPACGSDDPGIRVTVEDLKTGESESAVIHNDYIIVTAGACYVSYTQAFGTGTHQLTVKGRRA